MRLTPDHFRDACLDVERAIAELDRCAAGEIRRRTRVLVACTDRLAAAELRYRNGRLFERRGRVLQRARAAVDLAAARHRSAA